MGKAGYIFLDLPSLQPEQAQLLSDLLIDSVGTERLEKDCISVRFLPLHIVSRAGSPPKLRTYAPGLCTRTCGISLRGKQCLWGTAYDHLVIEEEP